MSSKNKTQAGAVEVQAKTKKQKVVYVIPFLGKQIHYGVKKNKWQLIAMKIGQTEDHAKKALELIKKKLGITLDKSKIYLAAHKTLEDNKEEGMSYEQEAFVYTFNALKVAPIKSIVSDVEVRQVDLKTIQNQAKFNHTPLFPISNQIVSGLGYNNLR
jgi:hypothetical protein